MWHNETFPPFFSSSHVGQLLIDLGQSGIEQPG